MEKLKKKYYNISEKMENLIKIILMHGGLSLGFEQITILKISHIHTKKFSDGSAWKPGFVIIGPLKTWVLMNCCKWNTNLQGQ